MKVKIENYKDDIKFIEVSNSDKLKVVLSTYGAGVFSYRFNNKPLLLEFKDKEEWLNCPQFYGKTLGRVAGRLNVEGKLNGKKYLLKDTGDGLNLHSGLLKSISFRNWKFKIKELKNRVDVVFKITSRNNDSGFLGNCKMQVIYSIYENNNFKITHKAKTDNETFVSMSSHNYYNLNSLDVSDYKMKINASKSAVMKEDLFIIGKEDIPEYLDYRKLSKLNKKVSYMEKNIFTKTIDHTFFFDEVNKKIPQCIVKNDQFKLSMYTTYPAMNIFLDNYGVSHKFNNFKEVDSKRRALALEPQLDITDLKSITLKKGEKYNHFILFKVKEL